MRLRARQTETAQQGTKEPDKETDREIAPLQLCM